MMGFQIQRGFRWDDRLCRPAEQWVPLFGYDEFHEDEAYRAFDEYCDAHPDHVVCLVTPKGRTVCWQGEWWQVFWSQP